GVAGADHAARSRADRRPDRRTAQPAGGPGMSLGGTGVGADRRLLPEGWLAGPMPWVIAIMVFLTVLAVAGGLGMANAAGALRADLAGRVTVQVIAADPAARAASADRVVAAL